MKARESELLLINTAPVAVRRRGGMLCEDIICNDCILRCKSTLCLLNFTFKGISSNDISNFLKRNYENKR